MGHQLKSWQKPLKSMEIFPPLGKKLESGHQETHLCDASHGSSLYVVVCILIERRKAQSEFLCFIHDYNEYRRATYLS